MLRYLGINILMFSRDARKKLDFSTKFCYFVFAHKNNIPFFPVKTSLMIAGIQSAVCIQGFLGQIWLNYKHMKNMDQQFNNTDEENNENFFYKN